MTQMDRLMASIEWHEGFRALCYDDATGKLVGPGYTLVGHPTIGYGWALNKQPMTRAFARVHARETVQEVIFELQHRLPWVAELDAVRQNALYELGYNLGIAGLLGFRKMLEALRRGRYAEAKAELLDSVWATQVQVTRRDTLASMIETGEWPHAA